MKLRATIAIIFMIVIVACGSAATIKPALKPQVEAKMASCKIVRDIIFNVREDAYPYARLTWKDLSVSPAPENLGKLSKYVGVWEGRYSTRDLPEADGDAVVIIRSISATTADVNLILVSQFGGQETFDVTQDGKLHQLTHPVSRLPEITQERTLELSPDNTTIKGVSGISVAAYGPFLFDVHRCDPTPD